VYGLGRGRVEISVPDPTPADNPYPSYSGRVFRSGVPGDRSGDRSTLFKGRAGPGPADFYWP